MKQITSRGNPDGPALNGKEQELVHLRTFDDNPACGTGAYNLRWSRVRKHISCPACRTRNNLDKK